MKEDYIILKQVFYSIIYILVFGFLTSSIFISVIFAIDYKPIYLITIILMVSLFLLIKKLDNHLFISYIKK
tara:strand:- start:149 stop:361 length:213 start_codon:yes stop_codon:yes gene_type:complete